MLQVLAACSAIIWMRTLLLVPSELRLDEDVTVFDQSVIGRWCHREAGGDEKSVSETQIEAIRSTSIQELTLVDLWPSIKSINTWQFTAFFTLLGCRCNSIQGWTV